MKPQIIEELSAQNIIEEMLKSTGLELLPSDPGMRIIEIFAYREYLLRQRINEVARNSLLRFNRDLDELNSFKRREGESLEAFRARLRLENSAASPGGSEDHYLAAVFRAVPTLKDAAITSHLGAIIIHALTSEEEDIKKIEREINKPSIKLLTDRVKVLKAKFKKVYLKIKVSLKNEAIYKHEEITKKIKDRLLEKFNNLRLGEGVTPSLLIKESFIDEGILDICVEGEIPEVKAEEYLFMEDIGVELL